MKTLYLTILAILLSPIATAQTPAPLSANVYGIGASFNQAGAPKVAGNFLYAHLLDGDKGTYSFNFIDIFPLKGKPGTVDTSVSTGLAQKVYTLGKARLFLASGVGVQMVNDHVGWDWNGGIAADYPIKNGWGVMPIARFDKGSATENYGYRFILSIMVRYGK